MSTSDETISAGLEDLGEFARERRRAAAQATERARPSFVEFVDYSEVMYTFTPPATALPLAQADSTTLAESIHRMYQSAPKLSDLSPLMEKHSKEEIMNMSENAMLAAILKSRSPSIVFEGGVFPLKNDFVAIHSIDVSFESVLVRAAGPSQVAEAIIVEFVEMLWKAAGVDKRWEHLSKSLVSTAYGTSTRVDLGLSVESLLSPAFRTFIQDDVVGGKNYAKFMGRQRVRNSSNPQPVSTMAALDELHMAVNTFDLSTGQHMANTVRFSVMAGSDYGTGRVRVSSTMHYDRHVEFLTDLINRLSPSTS